MNKYKLSLSPLQSLRTNEKLLKSSITVRIVSMSQKIKRTNPRTRVDFYEFTRLIHPIGKSAMEYALRNSYKKEISRGQYLIKPGEVGDYYFLAKGVLRSFIRQENKEITSWLCREGSMITPISNFTGNPNHEYLQALEDSELLCLPRDVIGYLYRRFSSVNVFARKLLEQYYADAEIRAIICRLPSAWLRYNWFLEIYPDLANRVPLKFIASFLGIRLETLSRIRRQKMTL